MDRHLFLSAQWIEVARELRAAYVGRVPPVSVVTRINVTVTDIPHGEETTLEGHIDTTGGEMVIEEGHVDGPELAITLDYLTAKAAFVNRDQQVMMQSFLSGKIYVEGDMSVLFALQGDPAETDDERVALLGELYAKMGSFTE